MVNGHWYKTPCKRVIQADFFTAIFFTDQHKVLAEVYDDMCCFKKIDNIKLDGLKRYCCIGKYNSKDLIMKLCGAFDSFINKSIPDTEKIAGFLSVDHVLDKIIEIVEKITNSEKDTEIVLDMLVNETKETTETEPNPATDSETAETEEKIPDLNNFHHAIIKVLGMTRAKEVRYTIQGVNVFFEYKGNMYKCYTPQSKIYKLFGLCFKRISWRDLKKESDETDDNSGDIYTARPPPESSLLNLS